MTPAKAEAIEVRGVPLARTMEAGADVEVAEVAQVLMEIIATPPVGSDGTDAITT